MTKTSLKIVHIRQSGKDVNIQNRKSFALKPERVGNWVSDTTPEQPQSSDESSTSSDSDMADIMAETQKSSQTNNTGHNDSVVDDNTWAGRRLRGNFRDFADWVFGPQGVASLQFVAFGDFSYGYEDDFNTFVLRRESKDTSKYRFVDDFDEDWEEIRNEYRNMLESCPIT